MAEMAMGLHTGEQESEWSQFDFGQSYQDYPPDTDFHSSTSLSEYHQHNYLDYAPVTHGVLYDRQGQAFLPNNQTIDFEGTDADNKITLTQDQVAVLESSFIAVPKPKTEHKKSLAEKLGLDPRRNWFQNRRAKAKLQKHPGHHESDASSTGAPSSNGTQPLSLSTADSQIFGTSSVQDTLPYTVAMFPNNFTATSTHGFDQFLDTKSGLADSVGMSFDRNGNGPLSVERYDVLTGGSAWPSDFHRSPAGERYLTSAAIKEATTSWSPQSPQACHTFAAAFGADGKDFANPSLMQNTVLGNGVLDNHSSQTLNSNPSSVGESNNLMTPPTNTPPLPWLSQEFDGRRTSDSSELAHNVEGLHLQHGQWGLGLANTTAPPPMGARMVSAAGIATPEASPDQAAAKAAMASSDIASRRKSHRPPALRPGTGRSISCGGSTNVSPQLRSSSTNLAPPNQVRRIQSQGQNLDRQSFRVHKSATHSAQISPRNLQKYLESQPLPQALAHAVEGSNTPTPTSMQDAHGKPSASAASASRSPTEYQHQFPVSRSINDWNNSTHIYNISHANSSVPDLSQPNPSLPIQGSGQLHTQLSPYQCPPQSAPSHQTRFFDDSPPLQSGPFPPSNWQGHPLPPPPSQQIGSNTTATHQTPHLAQHNKSGYLPPFAPSYQFPQDGSPMPGFPGTNLFPAFPSGMVASAAASPVELDIKVDVGPEPKLTSKFEKFEFQHTFSDKYGQNGEKK
ncbi:MAG: hypothetical protein Q9163_000923 [Psora crenata]